MDFLKEAKTNFQELASFFNSPKSCATYVRKELLLILPALGKIESIEVLIDSILEEKGEEPYSLPTLSLDSFLRFERNLLCIADGILFQTNLREFEMAVALESLRQHALLPLIQSSEDVQLFLKKNQQSSTLPKHTPRGF